MESLNFPAINATNDVLNLANDHLSNFYGLGLWLIGIFMTFWFVKFFIKSVVNRLLRKIF